MARPLTSVPPSSNTCWRARNHSLATTTTVQCIGNLRPAAAETSCPDPREKISLLAKHGTRDHGYQPFGHGAGLRRNERITRAPRELNHTDCYPFGAVVGPHVVDELECDQYGADDPDGEQERGDLGDGQPGVALGRQAQPDVVLGGHRGHGEHGDQAAQHGQEPLEMAHGRRVLEPGQDDDG